MRLNVIEDDGNEQDEHVIVDIFSLMYSNILRSFRQLRSFIEYKSTSIVTDNILYLQYFNIATSDIFEVMKHS